MRPSAEINPFIPAIIRTTLACLALFGWLTHSNANDTLPNNGGKEDQQLRHIQDKLRAVSGALKADALQLSEARTQSFKFAEQIAAAEKRQPGYAADIAGKQARIASLREQRRALVDELSAAAKSLERNALARYVLLMQPRMKVLLNISEVREISRTMAYYDYTMTTYGAEFKLLQTRYQNLADAAAKLKQETTELRRLRAEESNRLDRLKQARREHANLIAVIEKRMTEGESRAEQLRLDEQRLGELVGQLRQSPASSSSQAVSSFSELKGSFQWPSNGRVAKAPGSALRSGGARWAGVLIAGEPGTQVRAIAAGEIVFADWFRNLGNLVIIDHGEGYLSLYGNNSAVLKKPGDSVLAGDNIATVGDGSGDMPAGVYFELREGGQPIDPRKWFARN